MNATPRTLVAVFTVAAATIHLLGCAGRTAPFNEMDQAQITVLRLQGQEPPAPPVQAQTGVPQIPGLPPELQQMGQQALQGLQQVLPPGVIPPGLIPGQPTIAPPPPQLPRFKNFVILASMPLTDPTMKDEILDLFGSEDSFQAERGNCFFPGMGISMARQGQPPADLLISFSCNQVMGDGFAWPYQKNGLTQETSQRMSKVYERLWGGPVPPSGA